MKKLVAAAVAAGVVLLAIPVLIVVVVLGGTSETALACPPTGTTGTTGAVAAGLDPAAANVMAMVEAQFGPHDYAGVGERADNPDSDHAKGLAVDVMIEEWDSPRGRKEGNQIAAWLQTNANELQISYLIWRDQIWNTGQPADDTGWKAYTHPSGGASATQRHLDHVHVSIDPNTSSGTSSSTNASTNASTDASTGTVGSAGSVGVAGGCVGAYGEVVYPVPGEFVDADAANWGQSGGMWSSVHTGTDFSAPCGTPVYAVHAGTVQIDTSQGWAGPQLVKVVTGPSSLATWYAHMQAVSVTDGQGVLPGQQIGTIGELGNASGCHLHFEVHLRNGGIYGEDNTNPTVWLAENVGKSLGPVPGLPGMDPSQGGGVRVATFNVLGHSHTKPGGNKPGWPASTVRMRGAVAALTATGVEVAGFQEFEPFQSREFLDLTAGAWQVYPTPASGLNTVNTVAWRADRWELVRAERIPIPYFYGNEVPMPVVLLRNRSTGQQVWVGSFHNPADVRGPAQRWRDEAERRQAAWATRANRGGVPVIVTGDMNDRAGYFCDTVQAAELRAANGGTARPCRPPANMGIDWIMGSPEVAFSGYASDRSVVTARVADHPLVSATVSFN